MEQYKLFTPAKVGDIKIKNQHRHIAYDCRCRAIGNVLNDLHGQNITGRRSGDGLIIAEGTAAIAQMRAKAYTTHTEMLIIRNEVEGLEKVTKAVRDERRKKSSFN